MDTYAAWLIIMEPAGVGLLVAAGFAFAGRLIWSIFGRVSRA